MLCVCVCVYVYLEQGFIGEIEILGVLDSFLYACLPALFSYNGLTCIVCLFALWDHSVGHFPGCCSPFEIPFCGFLKYIVLIACLNASLHWWERMTADLLSIAPFTSNGLEPCMFKYMPHFFLQYHNHCYFPICLFRSFEFYAVHVVYIFVCFTYLQKKEL